MKVNGSPKISNLLFANQFKSDLMTKSLMNKTIQSLNDSKLQYSQQTKQLTRKIVEEIDPENRNHPNKSVTNQAIDN